MPSTRRSTRQDGEDAGPSLPGYRTLATLVGVAAGAGSATAPERDPLGEAVVAVLVTVGVAIAVVALGAVARSALRGRSPR